MFKSAIVYRITRGWIPDLAAIEKSLNRNKFTPCGATQARSCGFIEPRGEAHGPMVESIGRQWMITLCTETKKVPASTVQQHLIERLKMIEANTGRKPGKKETKEIKEEIVLQLLPQAFPQQGITKVWIDPENGFLVVDAGSQGKADAALNEMSTAIDGLSVALVSTAESPAACMAYWLKTQEGPNNFSVDRECELKATDESKSVVRYGRHALDIAEVQEHIDSGKMPTRLAMTWDDRVSFILTENLQIKKITFLDTVMEGAAEENGGYDADVAIATGELEKLFPDLFEALGGEVIIGIEDHADPMKHAEEPEMA